MLVFSYWIEMGSFYLAYFVYRDFKNNMMIDDRHNYFIMGLTFSLLSHVQRSWIYLVGLIFTSILFYIVLNKIKGIGGADASSLSWIYYGYAIINPAIMVWFFIIFIAIWVLFLLISKLMKKVVEKKGYKMPNRFPFYPVIFISWILNNLLFHLF